MPTIPEQIKQFNQGRLPGFLKLKYQLMSQNAFVFLRGTCHLFYEDLSKKNDLPNSPLTWICGDLHLENFGSYKGDNRLEYFDLNDFDEASLAPAIWEITRILTSIFVGFDSLSIPLNEAKKAANLFLTTYADTLANGKPKYIEPETSKGIVKSFLKAVGSRKQKELIRQRTVQKNGKLLFLIDATHLYKIDSKLKRDLISALNLWLKKNLDKQYGFKIHDVAFRVAGTGSLGVKRYVFLTEKMKGQKKYLLIDMKQAPASSLKPWLHATQPSWANEAERVITTQHWMQNVSPAFLNSMVFKNEPFVLKEMQPLADKINFQLIKKKPTNIERVIKDMAMLTASAQLRSSGRQGSAIADELVAFGKDRSWQKHILQYAYDYSKQVRKDFLQFQKAYQKNYFSNL